MKCFYRYKALCAQQQNAERIILTPRVSVALFSCWPKQKSSKKFTLKNVDLHIDNFINFVHFKPRTND